MGGRKGFYYSTGFGVDVEEFTYLPTYLPIYLEPLHIRELGRGRAQVRLLKTLLRPVPASCYLHRTRLLDFTSEEPGAAWYPHSSHPHMPLPFLQRIALPIPQIRPA